MNPYLSAKTLLPGVFEHVGHPWRVVDVGCGDGGWLLAAHELEPQAALLGVDLDPARHIPEETKNTLYGSAHVRRTGEFFLAMDLRNPIPLSETSVWRQSDLVICLEVAEHLPAQAAPGLVDLLASLASTPGANVLWSAASPGQGPYPPQGWLDWSPHWHWNEQDPSYWEGLFAQRRFRQDAEATAALRVPHDDVDPWYTSNICLFTRG